MSWLWQTVLRWTCEPKAFSFQCMTKFTTKIKKFKKKKTEKKKRSMSSTVFLNSFFPHIKFLLSHLPLCAKYCALLLIERGSIRTFPTWNCPIPLELHKIFPICPKSIWKTPFSFMSCLMTIIKTAIFLFHGSTASCGCLH